MSSERLDRVQQELGEHRVRLDILDRELRLVDSRVNDTDSKIDRLSQNFDALAADTRAEYKLIDEKLDKVLEQFNQYRGAISVGRWFAGIGLALIGTVTAVATFFKGS
ncbi:hypothetical protein [Litorivivens sp.]|uniref:hypothetical protein n=1 Tax=Litorivivens sp. TaxID=2020868 RepID=UPI0035645BB8